MIYFTKIQEILIDGLVKNLLSISNTPTDWNPELRSNHLLAVHAGERIQLYRLSGLEGFRLIYRIESGQPMDCLMNMANYFYLFFDENKCTNQNKSDKTQMNHYLVIIGPKYRKNMFGLL